MTLETHPCADCKLDLPLKQFAKYKGKRHPLCRTCLALDVADFKEWVLPYMEKRRAEGPPERGTEPWEIAVKERLELSLADKSAILCRNGRSAGRKGYRYGSNGKIPPMGLIRPWKYALEPVC